MMGRPLRGPDRGGAQHSGGPAGGGARSLRCRLLPSAVGSGDRRPLAQGRHPLEVLRRPLLLHELDGGFCVATPSPPLGLSVEYCIALLCSAVQPNAEQCSTCNAVPCRAVQCSAV
jgi:hypothetical protein